MKNIFIYLFGAFIFVFYGCGPGVMDSSKEIRNGYYFYRNNSIDQFIAPKVWNDDTPMIPSRVVRYEVAERYVSAKRETIAVGSSGSRIGSGHYDYWLLDTQSPCVYGPFTFGDLEKKINEMNLPKSLSQRGTKGSGQ